MTEPAATEPVPGRGGVMTWAGVAAGGATALLALWLVLDLPGTGEGQAASNLSQLGAALLAGLACLGAARRMDQGQGRRGWLLLAAGSLAWAAGQAVWTLSETVRREQPFPSPGDLGFTLATVGWLLGLVALAQQPDRSRWHIRTLVDGLMVAGSIFLISWMVLLEPLISDRSEDTFATGLTLFYPFGDVAILTMLVFLVARGSILPFRTIALLGSGFAVLALADSWFAYTELEGRAVATTSNVAWFAGFVLVALGGLSGILQPRAPQPAPATSGLVALLAPYAPLALALGIAVAGGATSTQSAEPVRFWLAMLLFALVLVRQVLVQLDNRALTDSLQAALADASDAALHDSLTGLANRSLLYQLLGREVERARRSGTGFALAFLDLDGFKAVNDRHGHHVGDEVLRAVAGRLEAAVRHADTVARLGGDEFVALLTPVTSGHEAQQAADRLTAALAEPIAVGSERFDIRASLGVVLGDGSQSTDELLTAADRRMYLDKAGRRAGGAGAEGDLSRLRSG